MQAMISGAHKRKSPEHDWREDIRVIGGLGMSKSSYERLKKPFKPPHPSYPNANGQHAKLGLGLTLAKQLGPDGLLSALNMKRISSPHQLVRPHHNHDGSVDVPEIILFDPEHCDNLPDSHQAYCRVVVEPFLAARLRPHQVEGVKFMFKCLTGLANPQFTGCIQSDSMGLGKTFQCISSLYILLTTGIHGQPTCKRALILVPSSLVTNWAREVIKWLGNRLSPIAIEETQAAAVKKALATIPDTLYASKPLLVIASYSTFRIHLDAFYSKKFDILICDEAHHLKNCESLINKAVAGLPCKLRILASGTPIQNDLKEFYAMFNTACPGLLGIPSEFRKQYEVPILRGRDADASPGEVENGLDRSNELVELCATFMLRRTGTVLKEYLPRRIQQVIFCAMSPLQKNIYSKFLEAALEGKRLERHDSLSTLPAITALKKLVCHPDLVYDLCRGSKSVKVVGGTSSAELRYSDDSIIGRKPARGPIAKLLVSDTRMNNSTGNVMGNAPIITGFEGLSSVFHEPSVYPPYRPHGMQSMHSGKTLVLEALLKSIKATAATDKVVLVSNYTETLDLVQKMCDANGWPTLRLDGSAQVKHRQPLVDTFNDPAHHSYVLLLSSRAGGVGLNIIGANRLILFDSNWNPAHDAQAMARVWREGQVKTCYIYRLLAASSIEEKIYQRQLAKEGLSRVVVDDKMDERRTFARDELKALFKVDLNNACDTHTAIKCECAGNGAGNGRPGTARNHTRRGDGILSWFHTTDVSTIPDPAWSVMSDFIRSKFITYAFSDHLVEESDEAEVQPQQPIVSGDPLPVEGVRADAACVPAALTPVLDMPFGQNSSDNSTSWDDDDSQPPLP